MNTMLHFYWSNGGIDVVIHVLFYKLSHSCMPYTYKNMCHVYIALFRQEVLSRRQDVHHLEC